MTATKLKRKPAERITMHDRSRVIELALSCPVHRLEEVIEKDPNRNAAVEAVKRSLFFAGCSIVAWRFAAQGEPTIECKKDGLHCTIEGRKGIVRYVEIVDATRDVSGDLFDL